MTSEQKNSMEELSPMPTDALPSVGQRLRAAREELRRDIANIAAETRIPQHHLQTIEDGAYENLPSRTYAIGFARTYARSVGLDEHEIANAVREELADGRARQSALAGGMEPGDAAKLPSAGLAWAGGFAAIILAIGLFAFFSSYYGAGTGPGSLLASEESAVEGSEQLADASDADAEPVVVPSADGQVVFTALEDGIWVRFYEDGGERLFEAQMASGDIFEVPADAVAPRINTGRPDAFAITIGGQSVPKLSEEPITMGDTPISAEALLARTDLASADPADSAQVQVN